MLHSIPIHTSKFSPFFSFLPFKSHSLQTRKISFVNDNKGRQEALLVPQCLLLLQKQATDHYHSNHSEEEWKEMLLFQILTNAHWLRNMNGRQGVGEICAHSNINKRKTMPPNLPLISHHISITCIGHNISIRQQPILCKLCFVYIESLWIHHS